ncbi:LPS assembly protein LptD [Parashewanella curva]|uniref:LPS-assembly protein LptD n=1 Tax=Parashewanella curva TaxID=2338552 RepID=A0A3L8PSQ2_9GAMM|nr:LPS assembly protein LptD [Parashewanella curva]RLV58431.1 LPS assembly protein LptD [Parashewanella curva]
MNFRFLLVLSLTPSIVIAQQASESEAASLHPKTDDSQCLILPPSAPRKSQATMGLNNNHIWIESDQSDAQMGKEAHFSGGVTFRQGPRHIYADEATVNSESQQLSAKGNLTFEDPLVTITADSIEGQMKNNSATLKGAQYWLKGQQVHGDAKQLEITPENNLILNGSSFTTCPPESQSWVLEANKIKIDSKEEWGEVWGAKLKIGDVPVMYVPYMTIPVSDKRKSGLLFPKFSTSTINGVELEVPIYWNIAPEYDLTFTPDYMSNRGLLSKVEFRYLMPGEQNNNQNGKLNFEYLPSDDHLQGNPNRYLYHWEHQGRINENLRVLTNFTDVSDNNYFTDFNSDVQQATDNQLVRVGELNYLNNDWDLGLKVQDIKVLGLSDKPYQVMPQLSFDYRFPELSNNLNFDIYSEVTNFAHDEDTHNSATRLHIEPRLLLPLYGPAGSFTTELKLYQTNYWQRNGLKSLGLEKSVSRTIPSIRLHGQVNLERQTQLFDQNYRQTFEPQIQYLYVGYQDQSNIALYDTAQLQEDYYGLFRDRRFSGLDRIADANQVTLGLTSRLFDESNSEKLKFSFGQIFYLRNSRVGLSNNELANQPSSSVLAAELDAHVYNDWYVSSEVQYDTKLNETRKYETTLDFRPEANKLFQLSYRFVRDLVNSNANTGDKVDIAQAGTRIAWPVKQNLYFVGDWYYDFKRKRSIESYAGFQYESCCWVARLSYHYRIRTNFNDNIATTPIDREQFESGIYLNFMIKGLGGSGNLGISDMLKDSIFNYRKPIYLTD